MTQHDPGVGGAQGSCRRNILLFLDGQDHAACNAREIVDEGKRDRDDDVGQAAAEHRDQINGNDEVGKSPLQVDVTHDDGVEETAEISCHEPQRDPADERQGNSDESDEQRNLCAIDQPAQQITPQIVGPQWMRPGRPVHHHEVHVVRVVGRDPGGKDCRHDESRQHNQTDQRLLVAHKLTAPQLGIAWTAIGSVGVKQSVLNHIGHLRLPNHS